MPRNAIIYSVGFFNVTWNLWLYFHQRKACFQFFSSEKLHHPQPDDLYSNHKLYPSNLFIFAIVLITIFSNHSSYPNLLLSQQKCYTVILTIGLQITLQYSFWFSHKNEIYKMENACVFEYQFSPINFHIIEMIVK